MRNLYLLLGILSAFFLSQAKAQEETRNYPLGPIGGQFRVTPNSSYARVVSLETGSPGAIAGLQVGDFIYGAFGKTFTPTGNYHYGVSQELGFAVDRAEGASGSLPLNVLRPGYGPLTVTVNLPAAGAFGPAYPRNSAKHQAMFDSACAYLHQRAMNSNGSLGYFTGWTGLCLLGHPNWNDTTGAKPYRLSINKIRDFCVGQITNGVYAAVEDKLFDGSSNPNFQSGALSNWQLGQMVMFLSEYYAKTSDAAVVPTIQRGAEMCANTVQWWKQPALGTSYSPEGTQIAGIVSHGGVTGDYIHLGWGGGINICGVYSFNGMAFARHVGMNMNARPRDGHYFGYATAPAGAVEAGKENYDHTIDEKFLMQWNWMGKRCAYYSASNSDDGHVAYTLNAPSGWDAAGRTPGTLLGMMLYKRNGGTTTVDEDNKIESMKGYITRHYIRQQEAHAYCVGAQMYQAMCMPFLSDRQQRFAMDNWRFYFALSRTATNGFQYFRSRSVNDNYLDETHCAALSVAMPYAVANGQFSVIPGFNNAANRVIANFRAPDITWPTLDARKITTTTATLAMPTDIVDGSGNALTAANYTAAWTKISGPGTVTFSQPSAATTNITFGSTGNYRVQLTVTRNGYTLTEPIDVVVTLQTPPAGYKAGIADYQVYTGISGSTVANLTSAAKFPNSPDIVRTVNKLAGDYSGNTYGARLSGCIIPPITGTYRFYIASDDASQLKLNASGLAPTGATVIASVSGATGANVWTTYPSQTSAAINLTAGQAVYFEALHKENSGSDHLSVGWSINGGAIEVIDGIYLAAPVAPEPTTMSIVSHPQNASAPLGGSATLSVTTTGPQPAFYQWRRNGVNLGTPTSTPSLTLTNISGGAEGDYDCVYTTMLGTLTSNTAHVTISDAGAIASGGLWREVYTGIGGGAVSDLTSHAKYPQAPDASGPITSAADADYGDDYGQRWTGWVKPTISGNYRFYLTADDQAEIWLSTNELPANKARILQLTSYTGAKSWSSRSPSAYFALEAGKRYYIEVRHKEGGGGDHCAVAWQRQGDPAPTNGSGEIPGQFLEYRIGGTFDDVPLNNQAPTFFADPFTKSDASQNLAYTGQTLATSASDFNSADTLTFSKISGPSWLSVATNGTLTGTPGAGTMGLNTFTVRVADQSGLSSQATLNITVAEQNFAPSFTSNPLNYPEATVLIAYSGSLTTAASDPNAQQIPLLTYTKLSGPAWLSIATNGNLSGTPATADIGVNNFSVRVTDPWGFTADATLNIEVLAPNFHFDTNGNLAGSGAASGGTWNTDALWTSNPAGTTATFPWVDSATAVFTAGNDATGSYTVTVSGTRTIGGFVSRSGSPTLTGGGLVPATGTTPFTVNTTTARIDTVISGSSRGVEKNGTGTLVLGGSNTYTGNTSITNGVLELATSGKLYNGGFTNTPVITIGNGGTWRMPDFSYAGVGQISDNAARRILDGGTIEVTGATHSSGQNFSVTAQGGTFRYTNASGTLTLSGNGGTNIPIAGNLTFDTTGQTTVGETIEGSGGLTKTGIGTLLLNTTGNTFSGNVLISSGVLLTTTVTGGGTNSPLGVVTGGRTVTIDNAVLRIPGNNLFGGSGKTAATLPGITVRNGGTLDSTRYNILGDVTLNGSAMQQSSSDSGSYEGFELLGTISVTGSTPSTISTTNGKANHLASWATVFSVADVTGNADADLVVSTPLRNPSGAYSGTGALTKSGTGTMRLTATSSYTGITTISGGTLDLAANLAAGSTVTVQSNGTLAGTASAAGATTIAGSLSPGSNGVGTLTTGALTLQTGSTLRWDLGASTTHDKVNATSLNLSGSPAITLRLSGANPAANGGTVTVPLIVTTGGITNFASASFTVDTSAIPGAVGTWRVIQQGNTLALSIQTGYDTAWRDLNFGAQANDPTIAGPAADPDGDGTSNLVEMHLGLNPRDPNSRLKLMLLSVTPNSGPRNFRLSPAVTAGTYTLDISLSPVGPWTSSVPVTISNAAGAFDFSVPNAQGGRFFRLRYTVPTPP